MLQQSSKEASCRAWYTGTHDNDTLMGFLGSENGAGEAERIIREIYEGDALLAMLQIQDVFLLGSEARMNVPGVPEGNWTWKIPGVSIYDAFPEADERAGWLRELAEETKR